MKLRISFLASVAVAMVLALLGAFNGVSGHTIPVYPIQPFASDALGGVSTTQLGQNIAGNWTVTLTQQGERSALPWIFSPPGFTVDPTEGTPTAVGTVWTTVDALCDGGVDYMADDCGLLDTPGYENYPGRASPLIWMSATAVKGSLGADSFLLAIMPPWPWLARHKVDINHLCLGTGGGSTNTVSVLNTVYAQVPFSPGGAAFVAQTKLGGSPTTPPSSACLDTPQSSESVTTIYNNPPLAGVDTGIAGDDNIGLYARWTILQSQGSSSLARAGDLRKSYASPPSIGSDWGYVERIVDLQCFWMDDDGCAGCDGPDLDTAISEVESWTDADLVALGGIGVVDTDGDCLAQADKAQPGRPADTDDEPNVSVCPASPYSAYPSSLTPPLNTSADTDCDTLVDGIEQAYGSDPTLADSDGDGATDFVEMFQFTNPIGTGSTDTDGDGYLDKPSTTYANPNTDTSMDNCPSVANPTQANSDGARRDNGGLSGTYASNPNQDKLGDACDDDDDNDGAIDGYELSTAGGKAATDPLDIDSDDDRVMDGAEWRLGTNPNDNSVEPTWSTLDQVYYRGCHINTAIEEEHSYTDWDAEYDGVENDVEYDPDGDGIVCSTDKDSDNGTGTLAAAKVELADSIEAFCYNTGLMNKDSDGDGCEDWVEIHDLNGDRTVNVGDSLNMSGATKCRKPGLATSDPVAFKICDVTCDGFINVGDDLSLAKNQCGAKPGTGGCPLCTAE